MEFHAILFYIIMIFGRTQERQTMTAFYSVEETERLNARARRTGRAAWAILGAAWLSSAVLCFFVRTENAGALFWTALILSGLGGLLFLYLRQVEALPARAEAQHMAGILKGESQTYTGRLYRTEQSFRIPGSIAVQRVRLETEEETVPLQINLRFARRLPPDGTEVRARCTRKYITAWEAAHE